MVGTLTRVSEPFLVRPGSGRVLDMGNFAATVLADGAATSGAFALLETHGEGHGFGPPMHVHRDAAEAFYVLEGTYQMYFQDREELAAPGTFVYVPQNAPHTFKLVSEGDGRKLNIFTPAAMVGFFEQLSEAEARGEATPELLGRIAARHQMEILGPVPDTYL
jgi:mannose-6-phosphate isomerase-like protein (cupin superfamily)